jgi:hypothetical protein
MSILCLHMRTRRETTAKGAISRKVSFDNAPGVGALTRMFDGHRL